MNAIKMIGDCMTFQAPSWNSPVGSRGDWLWKVEYTGFMSGAPAYLVLMSLRDDVAEAIERGLATE